MALRLWRASITVRAEPSIELGGTTLLPRLNMSYDASAVAETAAPTLR